MPCFRVSSPLGGGVGDKCHDAYFLIVLKRTFLSNRMRNAVTLGVSQNRLDSLGRDFKPFCDFSGAHAIVEVIDDGVDRHPCTAQNRSAALHSRLTSTSGHSDQSIVLHLAEEDRWRNMETLAEPRDVVAVQSTLAGKNQ